MRASHANRLSPYLLIVAAFTLAAVGCSPSPTVANGSASDDTLGSSAEATSPDAGDPNADDPVADNDAELSTTTTTAATTTTVVETVPPSALPLPDTAVALAAALDEAERAVRDTALTDADRDEWGRRQQSLYRHLSFNNAWADDVVANVDPALTDAVRLNWSARQSLSSLVNTETLHSELPAWRVLAPLPPETLLGYYKQAEADTGVAWEFLAAINLVETRMGRIQGVSTAGAIGPMQFLPTTWAECCEGDPSVPADAIAGAAKYLTDRGGPENMNRAIFGYNNSDYYVTAITSYASVMMADEQAYYGYHAWEIYFLSTEGLIRIPVGYEQLEPIPATDWLAQYPETLFAR